MCRRHTLVNQELRVSFFRSQICRRGFDRSHDCERNQLFDKHVHKFPDGLAISCDVRGKWKPCNEINLFG